MSNFFQRVFGRSTKGSSATAKDRLQFVLVHDRINLPPEQLNEMKEEILAVISKYVSVDRDHVDIALEQRDRSKTRLVAEIPFSNANRPQNSDPIPSENDEDDTLAADETTQTAAPEEDAEQSNTPATEKQEPEDELEDHESDKDV